VFLSDKYSQPCHVFARTEPTQVVSTEANNYKYVRYCKQYDIYALLPIASVLDIFENPPMISVLDLVVMTR
jgi:hypothetical protein